MLGVLSVVVGAHELHAAVKAAFAAVTAGRQG